MKWIPVSKYIQEIDKKKPISDTIIFTPVTIHKPTKCFLTNRKIINVL